MVLELAPERVDVHMEVGRTHLQLGYFDKAAASFGRAFDCASAQDDAAKAEEALGFLGRVQKASVDFRLREAKWHICNGESQAAMASMRECVQIFEDDPRSHDFSRVGATVVALSALDAEAGEQLGVYLAQRANALVSAGLFEAAIQALCWAIKAAPKTQKTYRHIAELLTAKGYGQEVIEVIEFVGRKLGGGDAVKELIALSEELSERQVLHPGDGALETKSGVDSADGWPFRLIVEEFEELEEIDLDGQGPFIEWEPSGLGDEITSPSPVSRAFAREVASAPVGSLTGAPDFGGECAARNLLNLLARLSAIEALSCVRFFAEGEAEPRAQMMVKNGEVLLGCRVQGRSLADLFEAGLVDAGGVDVAKICRRWDESFTDVSREDGREGSVAGVPDHRETYIYGVGTAHALARLAELGREVHLSVSVEAMSGDRSVQRFSTAMLLLEASALLCPHTDTSERLLEHDFGEERWVLQRSAGSDCYLPLGYSGSAVSFDELLEASVLVGELEASTRPLNQKGGGVGISFLSKQAAWGAVWDGEIVLLARCDNQDIGRLVSTMRSLTRE